MSSNVTSQTKMWKLKIKGALNGGIKAELVAILKLAIPAGLISCFGELVLFVSLIFVGHITGDAVELDAVALAISFINITATSVSLGMCTAAETLCSQAYGHKNFRKVGIILQRGILILALMMFPVWGFWLNADSILLALHQPPCISILTGQYMKVFCIALPFYFLNNILSRYLESQSVMMPLILSGGLCFVLAVVLHAVMIYGFKLDIVGASIALTLATVASPTIILTYIWKTNIYKKTWFGWSWESLNGWWSFVRLGLPGLLVNCFEWWAGEIAIITAGTIGKTDLALVSIYMNLLLFIFGPQYGLGTATTVRVGNELGAGRAKEAKRVAYICIACTVISALMIALVLECIRPFIGHVFTEDREVLDGIQSIIHLCAGSAVFDAVQFTITAVLRGCGRQFVSAAINFFCYYIIGLPIGLVLGLVLDMRALGLCVGLTCANVLQCIILCVVLVKINWNAEVERAKVHATDDVVSQSSENDNGTIQTDESNEVEESIGNDESVKEVSPERQTLEVNTVFLINGNGCNQIPQVWCSLSKRDQRSRLRNFFTKCAFFIIGFGILTAGFVLTSRYQPLEASRNSSYCYTPTSAEITNVSTELIIFITPSHTVHPHNNLQRPTISQSNVVYSSAFLSPTPVMYSPTPVMYSPTPAMYSPTPVMYTSVPDADV